MLTPISKKDCDSLLENIKAALMGADVKSAASATIEIANPDYWDVYLLIPSEGVPRRSVHPVVEDMLVHQCGVDKDRLEFSGKAKSRGNAWCWFFTHPNVPEEVQEWADEDAEQSSAADEELDELPQPWMTAAAKTDEAFLILKGKFFRAIERGEKTAEFRALTEYYVDRLLPYGKPVKRVVFQLGYSTPDGSQPPQMEFEVDAVNLFSSYDGTEIPAVANGRPVTRKDLPKGFHPTEYVLRLGKRIA